MQGRGERWRIMMANEETEWVEDRSWEDFRETGLLWFINSILHLFGWAIYVDVNPEDGSITKASPARVKYRGFSEDINDMGYQRVSEYLAKNAQILLKESEMEE